jgi:hypothetical protein
MPTEKPVNGCKQCKRLLDQYLAHIDESAMFLREYHDALQTQNSRKIEEMRGRVAEHDLIHVLATEALLCHQVTHNGEKEPPTQN